MKKKNRTTDLCLYNFLYHSMHIGSIIVCLFVCARGAVATPRYGHFIILLHLSHHHLIFGRYTISWCSLCVWNLVSEMAYQLAYKLGLPQSKMNQIYGIQMAFHCIIDRCYKIIDRAICAHIIFSNVLMALNGLISFIFGHEYVCTVNRAFDAVSQRTRIHPFTHTHTPSFHLTSFEMCHKLFIFLTTQFCVICAQRHLATTTLDFPFP